MELAIKLGGVFCGVLARTLAPYLRKLKQGKAKEFNNGYWVTAFAALVLGVISTLLIFPQFNVTQQGIGLEASIKLFCVAFAFGFACNSIVSEGAKWNGMK